MASGAKVALGVAAGLLVVLGGGTLVLLNVRPSRSDVARRELPAQPERPARAPDASLDRETPRAARAEPAPPAPAESARVSHEQVPTAPPDVAPTPPGKPIEEKLADTRITLDLQGATIPRVVGEIAAAADVEIVAPRALLESKNKITLALAGASAKDALHFVCMANKLEARIEKSRVVLAPAGGEAVDEDSLVAVPRPETIPEVRAALLVVDAAGAPVVGAVLVAAGKEIGRSGEGGRFVWTQRPPLPGVIARAPGHVESREVRVRTDAETTLSLRGAAATLRVTVRSAKGDAVAGAAVTVIPDAGDDGPIPWRPFVADSEGRCEDPSCPPGGARIAIAATGHARAVRRVTAIGGRETPLEVELDPESIVEGTVRDASGAPSWARIAIEGPEGAPDQGGARTDGSYRIEQLPRGRYRVVAERPDGATAEGTIDVGLGETRTLDLQLGAPKPR